MSKIADTLADGGHSVVLLQTYIVQHFGAVRLAKNKNVEIIDYYLDEKDIPDEEKSASALKDSWDSHLINNPIGVLWTTSYFYYLFRPMCEKVLSDKNIHNLILSRNFDATIAEAFDFCGLYLADHLKLKTLPAFSSIKSLSGSRAIGEPSPLNFAPTLHTNYGSDQSLWDRMQDITMYYSIYYASALQFDLQYYLARTFLDGEVRHWKDIFRTSTFFFYNHNPYVGFQIPKIEKSVEIGGFTVESDENAVLNEEYEAILNLRNATVLISFGTMIRSSDMPDYFKLAMAEMFKNLSNITFIWKYEVDDIDFSKSLSENVILTKWMPQAALLADSRLKLFMTHGGVGSAFELAYSGKPALLIPIFGDHLLATKMLARHGGARFYSKHDLRNSEKLTTAVRELISDESYEQNARMLAEIVRNQPISPRENLLKHAEFAVRFGRVEALEPYNVDYGFVQYYMLDAYTILVILCTFNCYLAFRVISNEQLVEAVADFCTGHYGYDSDFCVDYAMLRRSRATSNATVTTPEEIVNKTAGAEGPRPKIGGPGDIVLTKGNQTEIINTKAAMEDPDEEIASLTPQQIRDELRKIIQEEYAKKEIQESFADDPACSNLRDEYDEVCFATPPLAAFQETREFCLAFVKNCHNSLLTNIFTNVKNFKVDFAAYCKKHRERFRYVCPNPLRFQSFAEDAVQFCLRYKERCPKEVTPAEPVMFHKKDEGHIYTREIEFWCTRTKRTAYNYCTEPDLLKVYKYQMFCGMYKYACIDVYKRVIYGR
ncbi:unnamed protein product [Caenorhabditis sp. 36 PRJEB53466]|nr:unnamed protein product [Caenorhabditis sp. 36 PRJEB53466]